MGCYDRHKENISLEQMDFFLNNCNESGYMVGKKVILVAQGYIVDKKVLVIQKALHACTHR